MNTKMAISEEVIINKIYFIRDQKVMLDKDLPLKMEEIEKKVTGQDEKIGLIFSL